MKKFYTIITLLTLLITPNAFALTQGQNYRIDSNLATKVTEVKYRFIDINTWVTAYEFKTELSDGAPDTLNLRNVPLVPGTYYVDIQEYMPHPTEGWNMTVFYGSRQDFLIKVGQKSAEITVTMERTAGMQFFLTISDLPDGFTKSEDGWYNIQIFGQDGSSSGSAQIGDSGNLEMNGWTYSAFNATRAIITDGAGVQWVTALNIDAVTMASGEIISTEFNPEADTVKSSVNRRYAYEDLILNGMDDIFNSDRYQVFSYEVKLEEGETYDFITSPPTDSEITSSRQIYLRVLLGDRWMAWDGEYECYEGKDGYCHWYPTISGWECPASGTYTVIVEDAWGVANTGFNLQVVPQD